METRDENLVCDFYTPIGNFKEDDLHTQIFLIDKIESSNNMKTSKGDVYARVTLKDITGEINGVVWNWDKSLGIKAGDFVTLKISVNLYRDKLEYSCNFIQKCQEPPINIHDYVRCVGQGQLNDDKIKIQSICDNIEDEHYRSILGCALQSLDLLYALQISPYGLEGPLAYRGGLLVHTEQSLNILIHIVKEARLRGFEVDTSLAITGCILRNIGWHTTVVFEGDRLKPRDAYSMTGVHRASMRYIDHLMLHVESALNIKIPESKKQALENMCNPLRDIKTLEGRLVAQTNELCDTIHFGSWIS